MMKNVKKRLFSLLLAAVLTAVMLPLSAQAAGHQVYVYAQARETETVSDTFWKWEHFVQSFTGASEYRKKEIPAYKWKNTVTVTVDHDNGFVRLDFDRVVEQALPSPAEFAEDLSAYGAVIEGEKQAFDRAIAQYEWGRTYQYYRAREYLASTPEHAVLYAKLIPSDDGITYVGEPVVWDGTPYQGFWLELEEVVDYSLLGPPIGGLDPEKAKAYAADPASPPAMVFDKEVTVDDVLYEYIGKTIGCTVQDAGDAHGLKIVGYIKNDDQFWLASSAGGDKERFVADATGDPVNSANSRVSKSLADADYNTLFPEEIRRTLSGSGSGGGEGEIGLCRDVQFNPSQGSATANADGTVSIRPFDGYRVASVTVNGQEISFTVNDDGGTVIEGIRTTDKVAITFEEAEEGEIGLCKDVQFDSTKGSAIINGDGTISLYPAEGYVLASVTVNGKEIHFTTDVSGWTILSDIRTTDRVVITFEEAEGFVDVPDGVYYKPAVDWAVEHEITAGTDDHHFSPDNPCTRAQIVSFLWRMAGRPAPKSSSKFVDVTRSDYFYEAVVWAAEKGITAGTDARHFSPIAPCTRAQIVTFLWRYYDKPYVYGNSFRDVPAKDYYTKAVAWAAKTGVTSGTTPTSFSPNNTCTRAQGMAFLYRSSKLDPAAIDNDKTGYVPRSWSWEREGTEGYEPTYFTSGKYVRTDGRAVLYIESSTSCNFFSYQIYSLSGSGKGACIIPEIGNTSGYSEAWVDEWDGSWASDDGYISYFSDNGRHTITLKQLILEDMLLLYIDPCDGDYVLVREK